MADNVLFVSPDGRECRPMSDAPNDRRIEAWNGYTGWYLTQREGDEWPLHGPQQDGRFWEGGVWYPHPHYWREAFYG